MKHYSIMLKDLYTIVHFDVLWLVHYSCRIENSDNKFMCYLFCLISDEVDILGYGSSEGEDTDHSNSTDRSNSSDGGCGLSKMNLAGSVWGHAQRAATGMQVAALAAVNKQWVWPNHPSQLLLLLYMLLCNSQYIKLLLLLPSNPSVAVAVLRRTKAPVAVLPLLRTAELVPETTLWAESRWCCCQMVPSSPS